MSQTHTPWRSPLARSLHLNRSLVYARYLQLATVRQDGRPANRTVVFRGFLPETNQLQFVTDARSEKIDQIAYCRWGEACWYFPKSREQFRLFGMLRLVGQDEADEALKQARSRLWRDLSDSARLQFAWPHPGESRASAEAFSPAAPDPAEPLPQFSLLLLDPIQVDHLQLKGDPQNRDRYTRMDSQSWSNQSINP